MYVVNEKLQLYFANPHKKAKSLSDTLLFMLPAIFSHPRPIE